MGNVQQKFEPIFTGNSDSFLNSYSGQWFELASTKFYWERKCTGAVAVYHHLNLEKKELKVVNFCFKKGGDTTYAKGKAQLLKCGAGKLLVVFDGTPNFVVNSLKKSGNYQILEYKEGVYSVVYSPSGKNLWILARSVTFQNTGEYKELFEKWSSMPEFKNKLKEKDVSIYAKFVVPQSALSLE